MAESKEVDPNYLRILPQFLELKFDAAHKFEKQEWIIHNTVDESKFFLGILSGQIRKNWFGKNYEARSDKNEHKQEWEEFCKEHHVDMTRLPLRHYIYSKAGLKSLNLIGIDVHGGLKRLCDMLQSKGSATNHNSSWVIIKDPEMASKYINIGLPLSSALPDYPESLEKACHLYSKISTLVVPERDNDLDIKILLHGNSNKAWELAREKFRLKIKDHYRQMILDIAHEERLYGHLFDIRNKKRKRDAGS
ncbi:hypothetical protein B0J11DRAFT_595616 [Dendryphion nanum]|uniref:Uncharacterized protein n=1 Tax=Dendryphion nanum TaxID=256645 RepID=A0A9P9IA17_9PLEO|nr:hypothetical protein B0J11DRAFT_595616 [Dendryphion nanum]